MIYASQQELLNGYKPKANGEEWVKYTVAKQQLEVLEQIRREAAYESQKILDLCARMTELENAFRDLSRRFTVPK